jgi:hypothetical protein
MDPTEIKAATLITKNTSNKAAETIMKCRSVITTANAITMVRADMADHLTRTTAMETIVVEIITEAMAASNAIPKTMVRITGNP